MSEIIARQMISSHIRDIVLSKTVDPARFARMMGGLGQALGSFDQRIVGVKKLVRQIADAEYVTSVLEFVAYAESGGPLWSEIKIDSPELSA